MYEEDRAIYKYLSVHLPGSRNEQWVKHLIVNDVHERLYVARGFLYPCLGLLSLPDCWVCGIPSCNDISSSGKFSFYLDSLSNASMLS